MSQASIALMAFLPQANRLPGNTHIHSQLDGPNVMDILYKNLMIKVNLTN